MRKKVICKQYSDIHKQLIKNEKIFQVKNADHCIVQRREIDIWLAWELVREFWKRKDCEHFLGGLESGSESEVAQSYPTLCNPMDYSPSGFSVHGILQARILEWVAISFSRESSRPRDRTQVSGIADRHFNLWAILLRWSYNMPKLVEI